MTTEGPRLVWKSFRAPLLEQHSQTRHRSPHQECCGTERQDRFSHTRHQMSTDDKLETTETAARTDAEIEEAERADAFDEEASDAMTDSDALKKAGLEETNKPGVVLTLDVLIDRCLPEDFVDDEENDGDALRNVRWNILCASLVTRRVRQSQTTHTHTGACGSLLSLSLSVCVCVCASLPPSLSLSVQQPTKAARGQCRRIEEKDGPPQSAGTGWRWGRR